MAVQVIAGADNQDSFNHFVIKADYCSFVDNSEAVLLNLSTKQTYLVPQIALRILDEIKSSSNTNLTNSANNDFNKLGENQKEIIVMLIKTGFIADIGNK